MEEARRDEGVPKPGPRGARDQRRAREGRERHPSRDGRCRGKASNVGPHGALRRGGHPHARIHTIAEVREIAAVGRTLTTTRTPDGRTIRLPPVAVHPAATPPHPQPPPTPGAGERGGVGRTLTPPRPPGARPFPLPPVAVDLAATPREY